MSNALKFAVVAAVAGVSALISAQAVVVLSQRAPALRAARAEATLPMASALAQGEGRQATIQKSSDGHYWANGDVNGQASIRFLVDTGATAVALTPADAQRLGFRIPDLNFAYSVVTAGGPARAAAVKLASVTVAGATLQNVDALVIEKGLDTSLLGMTYLGRLASFQATRQALILQP